MVKSPTSTGSRSAVEVAQTRVTDVETGVWRADGDEAATARRGEVALSGKNDGTALTRLVALRRDHQHTVTSAAKSIVERMDVGRDPAVIVVEDNVEWVFGLEDVGKASSTNAVDRAIIGGSSAVVR